MYQYFSLYLQHILHAKETTSPAPVAAVSTKSGFVMERMTARTMLMRKAVVRIQKLEKTSCHGYRSFLLLGTEMLDIWLFKER